MNAGHGEQALLPSTSLNVLALQIVQLAPPNPSWHWQSEACCEAADAVTKLVAQGKHAWLPSADFQLLNAHAVQPPCESS